MQKSTKQEYVSKDVAVKQSGRSARRLLELASAGRIRKKFFRDPKTKRKITGFHVEDIAKLAEIPPGDRDIAALPQRGTRSAMMLWQPLKEHVEQLDSGVQITSRPWLTVDEASSYTGLPQKFLIALIGAGKLAALDVGVRQGGRWRIARRDLDAITGELHTE